MANQPKIIFYFIDFNNEFKKRTFTLKQLPKDKYQLETKQTGYGAIKVFGYKNRSGFHFIISNPNSLCIGKIFTALRQYGLDWISEEFDDDEKL